MDIAQPYFRKNIVNQWNEEMTLLKNIQQIIQRFIKAETAYIKALHDIQNYKLKQTSTYKNTNLLSIQIILMNFITGLETQHGEMVVNIKEDILPDLTENQQVQKVYRDDYLSFINEQKRDEEDIVLHYQAILQQYEETEDDTAAELFNECSQLYSILQKQREMNDKAVCTIFDNYCRILYNNQSITASAIRKLLVYISSATANTQFDIQLVSQKLAAFPPSNNYELIRDSLDIPNLHQGIIHTCPPPQPKQGFEFITENKIRYYSEEPRIPEIPFDYEKQQARSADSIDNREVDDIYPLSLQLLQQIIPHRENLNPFIIRSILSILTSHNPKEIQKSVDQIKEYLQQSKITKIHTTYLLLSTILFMSPEKMTSLNNTAYLSIINYLRDVYPDISRENITILTKFCSYFSLLS